MLFHRPCDRAQAIIDAMFPPEDRRRAAALVGSVRTFEPERCQIAVLRVGRGSIERLRDAVGLYRADYRDLLMAAGFGHDSAAHLRWRPGDDQAGMPLRPAYQLGPLPAKLVAHQGWGSGHHSGGSTLVIERDSDSGGWFMYTRTGTHEPCMYDSAAETLDELIAAATDTHGITPEMWVHAPAD